MSDYRIAVLPGDGIGPEITRAAERVLGRVKELQPGLDFQLASYDAGSDHYRRTGIALTDEVLDCCLQADAVLLAAIGLPDVRHPDGTEVQPEMMMGLRRSMDLFAAVRPIRLLPGVASPLKQVAPGIDFVVVRENLEGLFASFGGGAAVGDSAVTDSLMITRRGTERVVDFAFRLARRRNGRPGDGKRRVTCVDKANVFRSFAFFRKVFFEVAEQYRDIEADAAYIDAMSMYLVQAPQEYDVLVMENMFGDILSDLGAGVVGGLGMAPSAELGEQRGLFQPSHGSAPTIAGRNIANPIAMILSAAMMLDWLGQRNSDSRAIDSGRAIESAVRQCLEAGESLTPDLGGTGTTSSVADQVVKHLSI